MSIVVIFAIAFPQQQNCPAWYMEREGFGVNQDMLFQLLLVF
jgi:hypothetical protein